MRFRKINTLLMAICFGSFINSAYADWAVKSSDSAFDGEKHVILIGTLESDRAIMYECEGGKLSVSYIESDDKTEVAEGISVGDMAVKIDKNSPVIFYDVRGYRQNTKYIAIRSNYEESIKKSLSMLKNAKSKINVGVKFKDGETYSMTGDAIHAKSMSMGFASECDIKI